MLLKLHGVDTELTNPLRHRMRGIHTSKTPVSTSHQISFGPWWTLKDNRSHHHLEWDNLQCLAHLPRLECRACRTVWETAMCHQGCRPCSHLPQTAPIAVARRYRDSHQFLSKVVLDGVKALCNRPRWYATISCLESLSLSGLLDQACLYTFGLFYVWVSGMSLKEWNRRIPDDIQFCFCRDESCLAL